ncbi:MAG: hypothetical protein B6D64_14270 [Bacteroidetes bacterium 4484_276]|nr:MAG: hypothetical protein B6D64_14270 [Bacteroidetes bacterium 4484_276]OYT13037.1 MAG: hypothetical protein B6I19_07195 [Bacteroidetes bacterium 4572_114]
MVRGLDIFREYFRYFTGNYVIIGGTACDIIIDDAGFTPRGTRDIDIILVVEALSADFVRQFWQFVKEGHYGRKEKSTDERKHYRFINPENKKFPFQIELFSREPDLLDLDEGTPLTPIPVDDDLSSLSAILMNKDYYTYTIEHCTVDGNINFANTEALVCLKAKAFLDLTKRKAGGEKVDGRNIRKHKTDIFRLAVMLTEDDIFELPQSIQSDLQEFLDTIVTELPGQAMFKEMGLGSIAPGKVFQQILNSFQLNGK